MNTTHLSRTVCLIISVFSFPLSAFPQGSLTPPGPPAPTMKTLDQVEARTPIDPTHTPGDANNAFVISQPGSYYLTGNLGVAATNGIHVTAAGVTIDLNGFQISRIFAQFGSGILIDFAANHCMVRNGSITGFDYGVQASSRGGTFLQLRASNSNNGGLSGGEGWRFEGCTAHDNLNAGMISGDGSIFSDCTANRNQGAGILTTTGAALTNCAAYANQNVGILVNSDGTLINCTSSFNTAQEGISVGDGCTLINCAANDNTAKYGIQAGFGCSLSNCSASNNTSAASNSFGISCGGGCTLSHCSAFFTVSTAATATGSTGGGIFANYRSTISDCTAAVNHGDGIQVSYQCHIFGNTCSNAGANGGSGAGIHTTGDHNAIENNNVVTNSRGIEVESTGNLITANKSGGNFGSNYVIAADNRYGPIIDIRAAGAAAVNGSTTVASTASSTDPWANFSY